MVAEVEAPRTHRPVPTPISSLDGASAMFFSTGSVGTGSPLSVDSTRHSGNNASGVEASVSTGVQQMLPPLILVTTVDIGGGKNGQIELRQGDDPLVAAQAFCLKHNLPQGVIEPLAQHLLENVERAQGSPVLEEQGLASAEASSSAAASAPRVGSRHDAAPPRAPEGRPGAVVDLAAKAARGRPESRMLASSSSTDLAPKRSFQPTTAVSEARQHSRGYERNALRGSNRYDVGALRGSYDFDQEAAAHGDGLFAAALHLPGGEPSTGPTEYRRRAPSRASSRSSSIERGSVYSRLYENAQATARKLEEKRRQRDEELERSMQPSQSTMTWVSAQMMRDRDRGEFENYGERLYVEGLLELERKKALAEQRKQEQKEAELAGVTWRPKITRMAQAIRRDSDADDPYARLTARGTKKTKDVLEIWKRTAEENEVRECTFRPVINGRSEKMMNKRTTLLKEHNINAYDQLFLDADRRRQRQDEYLAWFPEEFTFHPVLHKPIKAGSKPDDADGVSSRAERLYNLHQRQLAKQQEKRLAAERGIDPVTGRALFKPETGRAPIFKRNSQKLSIGEYLYSISLEQKEKKAQQKEAEKVQREREATVRAAGLSQKLMERLKARRFAQIFQYLDQDGDGSVDLLDIILDEDLLASLDPEVRTDVEAAGRIHARSCGYRALSPRSHSSRSVTPRLQHQEKNSNDPMSGKPLDCSAFSALMEEAIQRHRGPRNYLLPVPAISRDPDEPRFHPEISLHSRELASKHRQSSVPVYELLHHSAHSSQEKLAAKKAAAMEEELKDCTFRPEFVSHQFVKEGRALKLAALLTTNKAHLDEQRSTNLQEEQEELENEVRAAFAATALSGAAARAFQATDVAGSNHPYYSTIAVALNNEDSAETALELNGEAGMVGNVRKESNSAGVDPAVWADDMQAPPSTGQEADPQDELPLQWDCDDSNWMLATP